MLGDILDHFFAMFFVESFRQWRRIFSAAAMSGRVATNAASHNLATSKISNFAPRVSSSQMICFFFDEINYADKSVFFTDRKLEGNDVSGKSLTHGVERKHQNPRQRDPSY